MGKGEAFYNPRSRSQVLVGLCLWSVKFTSMSQLPPNLLLRKGAKVDYFPTSSVKLWQINLLWRQAENKKFWTYSKMSIFPWAYSTWLNFPLLLLEHEGSFLGLYPGKLEELLEANLTTVTPMAVSPGVFNSHTKLPTVHQLLPFKYFSIPVPTSSAPGKLWFSVFACTSSCRQGYDFVM